MFANCIGITLISLNSGFLDECEKLAEIKMPYAGNISTLSISYCDSYYSENTSKFIAIQQ